MHLYDSEVEAKLIPIGERSWRKFVNVSLMWANLEGRQQKVAVRAVERYNLKEDGHIPDTPANVWYHKHCYSVYANVSNIERACKREDKKIEKIREKLEAYQRSDGCGDMAPTPKISIGSAFTRWCHLKEDKKLRSHAGVATFLLDRYDQNENVTSPVTSPPVKKKRKSRLAAHLQSCPESQDHLHQTG